MGGEVDGIIGATAGGGCAGIVTGVECAAAAGEGAAGGCELTGGDQAGGDGAGRACATGHGW